MKFPSKETMSFSGLSIALSLVFGSLLLALAAQLYYFLWWRKKRRTHSDIEMGQGNYPRGLFHWGCWKVPRTVHATNNQGNVTREGQETKIHEQDLELGGDGKDFVPKSCREEGVESELMRLHNLAGPPRFLFTITEETKEDLESEDSKSRSRKGSRTRSLSDLMFAIDTPFLTPVGSSPLKCPLDTLDSYKHRGFNPLFESSVESQLSRFRSSPPPKFKFLRDAEEKLYRRLIEEAKKKALFGVKDSSNATMDIERKELQQHLPQFPSGSSQVLPLASSPTTFIPLEKTSMVH